MLTHSKSPLRRAGFTLVEMLVAAAVSILLMVIITGAFTRGLEMFSKLRAQAKLQDTIRQAGTTIKDDLSWNHFQMPSSSGYGDDNAYVRGQDLTKADNQWAPPPNGFFRIVNANEPGGGGQPFVFDGSDSFGYSFTRATAHSMHFTVQRPGSGPDQMFRVRDARRGPFFPNPPPPGPPQPQIFPTNFIDPLDYREPANAGQFAPFVTRWSEVAYHMVANGEAANGVPLFNLYRAQKLLLPLPSTLSQPTALNGAPNNVNVTVATNYVPTAVPAPAPLNIQYNPEMSRRYIVSPYQANNPNLAPNNPNTANNRPFPPFLPFAQPNPSQYPPPVGPQPDFEAYNRATDVTQPRFRYGMLPASHRANPNPPASARSYANLAGLFQIANPTYQGRYPIMADAPLNTGVQNPFGVGPNDPDQRSNNDLLLTNVISFEIKAYWTGNPTPNRTYTVPDGAGFQIVNPDYPFDYIPLSPEIVNPPYMGNMVLRDRGLRVFDTWSGRGPTWFYPLAGPPATTNTPYNWVENPAVPAPDPRRLPMWQRTDPVANREATAARLPLRIRVRAVQIRIRIWDAKSEQTRQVTIVQDV